ncbi:MAG: hypothetical protein ACR2KK_03170 [Acidimicrobiales bacterium]
MAANKRRRPPRSGSPERKPASHAAAADRAALDEIQTLLDAPLVDLIGTAEERAEVEELSRHAAAAPAIARLREVVAFVGTGRPATQVGNLKAGDALALARRLGHTARGPEHVRTMEDVPEAAHAFRWAVAAEFLSCRGTRSWPGHVPSTSSVTRSRPG